MLPRLIQSAVGGFALLRSVIYSLCSYVVPKSRELIVFYPAFEPRKFSGNLRPMFVAMSQDAPQGRTCVWLTQSRETGAELRARGLRVSYSRFRPVWMLLRAELILLDKNEPRIGLGRFRMVQVWHGTGFKRIALETPGLSRSRLLAMRWHFSRYALIVANCEEDRQRKMRCFDNPNVEILGSPRNDSLMRPVSRTLAERFGFDQALRVMTYCPTYRDSGEARPFTEDGWRALDAMLRETRSLMLVKRHRFDNALRIPDGLTHVRDVSGQTGDVMELLAGTDLLISDYSSIVTDFVLTGRPLVFFTYDAEAYRARGGRLYYDLFETLPGPFVEDQAALIDALRSESWFFAPEYQARYRAFRERFHHYIDDRSTERTIAACEALMLGRTRKEDK